jgi:hypothetical protein
MRRHPNGLLVQTAAKPFTNFLAERLVMEAADVGITFMRAMGHEISNRYC